MYWHRYIVKRVGYERSRQAAAESSDMQNLYARSLACCSHVWYAVRGVLCSDAPEGRHVHDHEEYDDEADDRSKDTLSFYWRALKESRSVSDMVDINCET